MKEKEEVQEKKIIKIRLRTVIFISIAILIIFVAIGYNLYTYITNRQNISKVSNENNNNNNQIFSSDTIENKNNNNQMFSSDTVEIEKHNNMEYYIIKDDYTGEYDLQFITISQNYGLPYEVEKIFKKQTLMNYAEYKKYCEEWGIKQKYSETSQNYIIFSYFIKSKIDDARLADVIYNNNNVDLYIWDDIGLGDTEDFSAYVIIIPATKIINKVNVEAVYTNEEFENIKSRPSISVGPIAKPVIYLYPEEEQKVNVRVGNPERLTHTYPKYEESWNVIAMPNGDLTDTKTGRNLYCLYWEGINTVKPNMEEGFVVKGEDTIKFLEEKLEILGLSEREANEFIIYWLPKMENNKYNFIRFQTEEEINKNMPLNITPNPDTIIRIIMEFKGLDKEIMVKEQELKTPTRDGFVVVEWGGTEIK